MTFTITPHRCPDYDKPVIQPSYEPPPVKNQRQRRKHDRRVRK